MTMSACCDAVGDRHRIRANLGYVRKKTEQSDTK
jgi:hypothetical protein